MRSKLRRLMIKMGHKGSVLAAFAITAFVYGAGLASGYHPRFYVLGHINVHVFGFVFIVLGIFALTGEFLKRDAFHYAVCVLAATAWTVLLAVYGVPFGWTSSASWIGIDLMMIISAAWPEELLFPRLPPVPDLPPVPEERHD